MIYKMLHLQYCTIYYIYIFVSTIVSLKDLWGYIILWVGNLTEKKSLCVQWDLHYGYFGSHGMLKIEYNHFLTM
jgi:hypothetical protein